MPKKKSRPSPDAGKVNVVDVTEKMRGTGVQIIGSMQPPTKAENTLYYGDNLDVMRRYLKDESADLIYLDPPFNSKQIYNAFFKEKGGAAAASQIKAFEDTWHWVHKDNESFTVLQSILDDTRTPESVRKLLPAFYDFLGGCDMMAYVMMMAPRLVELHRVLKSTGSLYLHCDPTASHYLRLILDSIFGVKNFQNEIVWQRTSAHNDPSRYGRVHDVLLFYAKTENRFWIDQYEPPDEAFFGAHDFEKDADGKLYRKRDLTAPGHGTTSGQFEWKDKRPPKGRMWSYTKDNMEKLEAEGRIVYTRTGMPRLKIYADKLQGVPLQDVWATPKLWLNSAADERLDYPTQKPLALLRRIISSSCPKDGLVFDPFCGCGTTVDAAQEMGFRWIGIDITQVAITTIKKRLVDTYANKQTPVRFLRASDPESLPPAPKSDTDELVVRVVGEPVTPEDAAKMAKEDEYGFQWWAAGLVGGRGTEKKKGPDGGIDGKVLFRDDPKSVSSQEIILQVKGGQLKADDVRALGYVVEREKAAIGVLISIEQPTEKMYRDAAAAGYYTHKLNEQKFPRLQLRTVKELMEGKGIERPSSAASVDNTFKKAPKAAAPDTSQSLPLE